MILAGDFIPKDLKVHLPDELRGKLVLSNLEGPICADGLPRSNKVGVCLHTSQELFDCSDCSIVRLDGGVEAPRFAFSLANNHMMDFCEEGLRQTKVALASLGIAFAGAGDNEEEARKPMILEENGKRIAVFCCCERQFGMATAVSAGCAEKGVWLYSAIREIKSSGVADFVIVSCHAANEFSPWPTPVLRDFYHSLIDCGADCIHGHHAHVPQGWEVYGGKPIFYGLGNFVVKADDWGAYPHYHWSLVAQVQFGKGGIEFSVTPYDVTVKGGQIVVERSVKGGQKQDDYICHANAPLKSQGALLSIWQEVSCRFYQRIYEQSLRTASVKGHSLSLRDRLRKLYFAMQDVVRAIIGWERVTEASLHYGKVVYNYFNNESHAVTISTALGVLTGVEPDCRSEDTRRMADEVLL